MKSIPKSHAAVALLSAALSLPAHAGAGSSGGGNLSAETVREEIARIRRDEILPMLLQVQPKLKEQGLDALLGGNFDRLVSAVRGDRLPKVQVQIQEGPVLLNGSPVDAISYPQEMRTEYQRARFSALDGCARARLVLHEFHVLAELEASLHYGATNALARFLPSCKDNEWVKGLSRRGKDCGNEPGHRLKFEWGGGFVADTASVDRNSFVDRDAAVCGHARVIGSHIDHDAVVTDHAVIEGSWIAGGEVQGSAHLVSARLDSTSDGTPVIGGNAVVAHSTIGGPVEVWGNARIWWSRLKGMREGTVKVFEDATVFHASMIGNSKAYGHAWVGSMKGQPDKEFMPGYPGNAVMLGSSEAFGEAVVTCSVAGSNQVTDYKYCLNQ